MPSLSPMTVEFTPGTAARLNDFAVRQNREGHEIIEEAVTSYLDYMSNFEREVQKGLDAADAGRFTSHTELKKTLRGMGLDLD